MAEDGALTWGEWAPPLSPNPYVDWMRFEFPDREVFQPERFVQFQSARFDPNPIVTESAASDVLEEFSKLITASPKAYRDSELHKASFAFEKRDVPVPNFALRKLAVADSGSAGRGADLDYGLSLPPPEDLLPGDVPDKTIIMGVIDIGIPLGHNRSRMQDGRTRILAAWQNLGVWKPDQPYLPYGREFYRDGIDCLLREHSGGDLTGWLDEESFNRATGVVNMREPLGNREAAGGAAHGAHVLDLAAGIDPDLDAGIDPTDPEIRQDQEFRDHVKIIAVNIPDNKVVGPSGTFLDGFLIHAINRIVMLSDAIWAKNNNEKLVDGRLPDGGGYPIIFNISFGKQAGSKTSLDPLAAAVRDLTDLRERSEQKGPDEPAWAPIDFVMPTGNSNLTRCNAFLEPKSDETLSLDWRIQPEDQSANYVEIWTAPPETNDRVFDPDGVFPLHVALVPPSGADVVVPLTNEASKVSVLTGGIAAIYCEKVDPGDGSGCLLRHVLCIAPTLRPGAEGPVAPAGLWTIKVRNNGAVQAQCVLSVQTDQALSPGRPINRNSYFDHSNYRVYDDAGRAIGSYEYPAQGGDPPKNRDLEPDEPSPVKRHGTMNALAAHKYVARIGGYRLSDGAPADYASTGRGRRGGWDDGCKVPVNRRDSSAAPTASLPTEDGPAHFGILAAGAANGSVVAMRGTSFAAPQAARLIAMERLVNTAPDRSDRHRLFLAANADEARDSDLRVHKPSSAHAAERHDALIETLGGGRIAPVTKPRVSRTNREEDDGRPSDAKRGVS